MHRALLPLAALLACHAGEPAAQAPVVAHAAPPVPASAPSDPSAPVPRAPTKEELARYAWLEPSASIRTLDETFAPPAGFTRVAVTAGSFGAWLRGLPLRPAGTPVLGYDGRIVCEPGDARVAAVAELDVGTRDLQQCADSIVRLHAEWLWSAGRAAVVSYLFTSGDPAPFARYAAGDRVRFENKKLIWARTARPDSSHASFRRYLDLVFTYASTQSLAREGHAVKQADVAPGDFLVWPGSPGHAVLILDVATSPDGHRVALIGQGYMPAQDFHVLSSGEGGPWFSLDGDAVATPFWPPFAWTALRRF